MVQRELHHPQGRAQLAPGPAAILPALRLFHLAALVLWVVTALAYPVLVLRGRRGGPEGELEARRRWHRLLTMETAFFVALLLSGFLAMRLHGWRLGYPRWLSLKLGLVAFLLVPLETIYAYAARGFLTRGLRKTKAPPFTREMERGVSMQEMVWALAIPLVGLALPLLVWLSLARPF